MSLSPRACACARLPFKGKRAAWGVRRGKNHLRTSVGWRRRCTFGWWGARSSHWLGRPSSNIELGTLSIPSPTMELETLSLPEQGSERLGIVSVRDATTPWIRRVKIRAWGSMQRFGRHPTRVLEKCLGIHWFRLLAVLWLCPRPFRKGPEQRPSEREEASIFYSLAGADKN